MNDPGEPEATLERVYRQILKERMAGLPFVNPALTVSAIGFRPWNDGLIGVMLTPWFMNLMALPGSDDWQDAAPGQQLTYRFPAGDFRFTAGDEPGIGRYRMCSLYSPVLQFADQTTAEAVAEQILLELMRVPAPPGISRRQLLSGRFGGHGETAA
ncbi:MAG: [NiFe]-hydrogenase assembly chaperone HybE [Methylococcaceae bacterium]|nr:[NiFe]-hydrogenase assembly chaperone HybE [Methylococcaceae bacterium]